MALLQVSEGFIKWQSNSNSMKKIETIENKWDLLYRDYPEIYDEFASISKKPDVVAIIKKMFDFKDKVIADIGSGSGKSTFPLAKAAKFVIGIEPEYSMRRLAVKYARSVKIKNVEFKKGFAENIPLKIGSVDFVIGITIASFHDPENIKRFVRESSRVAKKGGFIITVNIAPGWYGGELAPVILGRSRKTLVDTEGVADKTFTGLGFKHKDFYQMQDYGTVTKAVRTYGFIFGKKVIGFIKKNKVTKIKWKSRI